MLLKYEFSAICKLIVTSLKKYVDQCLRVFNKMLHKRFSNFVHLSRFSRHLSLITFYLLPLVIRFLLPITVNT